MEKYDPKGHASNKGMQKVAFQESKPRPDLSRIVHRFLEMKTIELLEQEYILHALPDVCVYIVFDQHNTDIAGVSKLNITSCEFQLGREFECVYVRLYPGVWQNMEEVTFGQINKKYEGSLPLVEVNRQLKGRSFSEKQEILSKLLIELSQQGILMENGVTRQIISNLDRINSVQDMADIANKSSRQLQRILKRSTGMTPHDFLKVLRVQKTFQSHPLDHYSDQSHFIRSLRSITGYTPRNFEIKFDV